MCVRVCVCVMATLVSDFCTRCRQNSCTNKSVCVCAYVYRNAVSDAPDLTQAQQEVAMTDIKLYSTEESHLCDESSHDLRTSVL